MHVEYMEHSHAEASVLQRGARLIWRSRSCCTCEYPVWLAEIVGGDAHARSAAKPSADDEEDDQPLMHIFDEDEWQDFFSAALWISSLSWDDVKPANEGLCVRDDKGVRAENEKNLDDTNI